MIYEKCRDILLQEFELVQNAVFVQEKIRIAVTERDWALFEDNMNVMNGIEIQLANLESEREQLFSVFKALVHQQSFSETLDDRGRFYALVALLPETQRNDLTSIYRSLKLEAIKLKMANEALMAYINGIKSTLQDFVDLAFVERGGKMYTKDGTNFSHEMSSMVLNQSF
ncbi:MAG: hypothetical protein FWC01_09690 [Treponema sp.]|nr:hypothetical protein [Treponema sp.]